MSLLKTIQDKLEELISGNNEEHKRKDSLETTDPDYMLHSPTVVGYNSTSEQQYLFQNLIAGIDPTVNSILDIGCGRADLYGYLLDVYGNVISYKGIDHNPIMINLAKQKYNVDAEAVSFENLKSDTYDCVVASGVFTQRRCETEDAELVKVFQDIDKMYNLCNLSVSFNLLSPINTKLHDGFFYVHPGLIMDMLIEKYQYVSVRHNYSKDVYTVTILNSNK